MDAVTTFFRPEALTSGSSVRLAAELSVLMRTPSASSSTPRGPVDGARGVMHTTDTGFDLVWSARGATSTPNSAAGICRNAHCRLSSRRRLRQEAAPELAAQLSNFGQEPVVPDRRPDEVDIHVPGQGPGKLVGLRWEIEPVGVDGGHKEPCRGCGQGFGQGSPSPADVVAHQRFGQGNIAVGVKALHQLVALVVQVAFHLVAAAGGQDFPPQWRFRRLGFTSETAFQLGGGPVGDVGDPAGEGQSLFRTPAAVVVPAVEVGILPDGQGLRLCEGNLFGSTGA